MKIRALLRIIHLWIGVALIAPLLVITISGTLLLFVNNIVELRLPLIAKAQYSDSHQQIANDLKTIDQLTKGLGWNLVRLPEPERPYYDVWMMNDDRGYLLSGQSEFIDQFSPLARAETFIYDLHAHLLNDSFGEPLVAWLGLFSMVSIIIGFVLWLPRWRSIKRAALRPNFNSRGSLLKSHMTWGGLFLLPILLSVTTGVMTAFPNATSGIMTSLAGGDTPRHEIPTTPFPHADPDWSSILRSAQQVFSNDQLIYLFKPAPSENGAIYIRTRNAGEWHPNGRSEIYINASTAAVLATTDARTLGAGNTIANSVFPTHAAQGSMSILWPILAVAGFVLSLIIILSGCAYVSRFKRRVTSV